MTLRFAFHEPLPDSMNKMPRRKISRRPENSRKRRVSLRADQTSLFIHPIVTYIALLAAALVAYWPAINGDLLWDDDRHITRPDLQAFDGLRQIWFHVGATQQFYPLLHTAFWCEHRLWGDAVLGYHLTNIVLHAVSAYLLVMIARRLSLPGALIIGSVFALHPVYVESVAWISEQKSTLSGVFFLSSALLYLGFEQTRRRLDYFLALGFFVLALLSKTVTAMLPIVLLVVVWWRRGQIEWKRDVRPLLPWIVLGAPVGLFTAWVERTYIGAAGAQFIMTPIQRALLAGRVLCFYAAKVVVPVNLVFSYPHWKIAPATGWQWLFPMATLVMTAVLFSIRKQTRGPFAGLLIFAITLFPVLGFLNVYPFRYSYVADHFQYLASLGVIVPLTSAVAAILEQKASPWRIPLCAALLLTLMVLTRNQSGMYKDVETLYRDTLARNPNSWLAHNNLGLILEGMPGRVPDAIAEFKEAVSIEPNYPESHFNLGSALAHSDVPDQLAEAIFEYRKAIRLKPDYAEAYNNLGNALSHIPGRLPEAMSNYEAALKLNPNLAEAHANLGNAFVQMGGRLPDAVRQYQYAIQIQPTSSRLRVNLANALSQQNGRLMDAIAEYQHAVQLDPTYADAHVYLASALAQVPGREEEALAECETALRIDPDLQAAQWLLEKLNTSTYTSAKER